MLFSRGQKIKNIRKIEQKRLFLQHSWFLFYSVSRAKTDLHSKYIFNFVFVSIFEQDHLLNLSILGIYAKT